MPTRNHFSKWLNARALFPVAQMFKYIRKEDFETMDEMRRFLYVAISSFRLGKGRGVIAKFDKQVLMNTRFFRESEKDQLEEKQEDWHL